MGDGSARPAATPFGTFLRGISAELADARQRRAPSPTTPGPDWLRLSTGTTPIPGQSLRGLVAEACWNNDVPNSWGILKDLGLPHRNKVLVSEDPNIDPAELAYAIRVDASEVISRRYEPLGRRRVDFFGMEIDSQRISTTVRRFSPTALRTAGHHRAVWELEDLPFCLEGWDMLQDRCGCGPNGVVQRWTRTQTRVRECDACGDPLEWIEAFPVPDAMRAALSILEPLVDPRPERRDLSRERLPEPLCSAERARVFDLVVRIANYIDLNARARSIEEPTARLYGLHRACVALGGWPDAFVAIEWDPGAAPSSIAALQSEWRSLASGRHEPPARATKGQGRQPRKYVRVAKSPFVGMRKATELARLSPEVLQAAWDHGFVAHHERMHGAKKLAAFDPAELATFGDLWRSRIEPQSLAVTLGIALHGVEQMSEMNVVIADVPALPGTGPHFSQARIDEFLTAFAGAATPRDLFAEEDDRFIRLVDALVLIGGRAKPWGPIMAAMIGGGLPFRLGDGRLPVDRIHISRDDIETIRSMTFTPANGSGQGYIGTMVQRDAFELLNVGPSGVRLLDGLTSHGVNPKYYSVADVARRAAAIASLPEVAAHAGRDPATTHQRLLKLRLANPDRFVEVIPGGWSRDILRTIRADIDATDHENWPDVAAAA